MGETAIELDKIKVKVATSLEDQAEVELLLSRFHPLGLKKAIGRRLTYTVTCKGEVLAVLMFDAAVKRCKLREEHIGWSREQCQRRVIHIANNSRYVTSKRVSDTPNAASKILSLVTERIATDWMQQYGVPLLAVETYVDPERNDNEGTCYVAAGWEKLGLSTGYQARRGEARTHSKLYFLKPLNPNSYGALKADIPHALLTGVKAVSGKSNNNFVLDASKLDMKVLQKYLSHVKDPRKKQGLKYPFLPLLSLCLAAVMSGYTQYRQIADWISRIPAADRARFGLPGDSVPEESTISKFVRAIDPTELQDALNTWLMDTYNIKRDLSVVSIDGKELRATDSDMANRVSFLNVFASDIGIVIDHRPTQKGGGEISTAHKVLESDINLEGTVVLADALHTNKQMVDDIVKKKPRTYLQSKAIKSILKASCNPC